MKNIIFATAVTLALVTTSGTATAATIAFDAPAYGAFTGSATEAGYTYSVASGSLFKNTFGNPGGDIDGMNYTSGGVLSFVSASASLFSFGGFDFANFNGSGSDVKTLTVTGFLNGITVGSASYQLASTTVFSPKYANWTTFGSSTLSGLVLDNIRFNIAGGTGDSHAAIDNVVLNAAAVPEPASWGMMIFGMGAIGFAMRGRKITTRVSYTA